ncbi:MAG TPA: 5-formyltetrahydrofolate cyclo-ligase [Gammaproteobacteria bacterium]|nr:5-formyltetrahydrofolate cyclo-ligase [Gammaproteobacteria bacterium]
MRQRRRALDDVPQGGAGTSIRKIISPTLMFRKASRVAFYMPFDGEVSPIELCSLSHDMGKQCYLPRVTGSKLTFEQYVPDSTPMRRNRFDIAEPMIRQPISPKILDVVFMPLVAFDQNGNRLGMGKGYYDNTFAGIDQWWHKPLLVGLAHSFQETVLNPRDGDIPMDAVVTESSLVSFEQRRKHLH